MYPDICQTVACTTWRITTTVFLVVRMCIGVVLLIFIGCVKISDFEFRDFLAFYRFFYKSYKKLQYVTMTGETLSQVAIISI